MEKVRYSIAFALLFCHPFINVSAFASDTEYVGGCEDPLYHDYIESQFKNYVATNKRLYEQSLRDYERSLSTGNNPYQVINELSRHLKYSGQLDPIEMVQSKITKIFEHADELSIEAQIAGDAFDNFSTETHAVDIARAWVAYREGKNELAFDTLLQSIERDQSEILRTFGPDFELVRQLYSDGHAAPVIAYINKTKTFWKGERQNKLRFVWQEMINAKCKVQFTSDDALQFLKLGLQNVDPNDAEFAHIIGEWSLNYSQRLPSRQLLDIKSAKEGTWTWYHDDGRQLVFQLDSLKKVDDVFILRLSNEKSHSSFKLVLSGWAFHSQQVDRNLSSRMFGTAYEYNEYVSTKRVLMDGHAVTFSYGRDGLTPQAFISLFDKPSPQQLSQSEFDALMKSFEQDSRIQKELFENTVTYSYTPANLVVIFTSAKHEAFPAFLYLMPNEQELKVNIRGGYVNERDNYHALKAETETIINEAMAELLPLIPTQ